MNFSFCYKLTLVQLQIHTDIKPHTSPYQPCSRRATRTARLLSGWPTLSTKQLVSPIFILSTSRDADARLPPFRQLHNETEIL